MTFMLCVACFVLGYIIGHGDGKLGGWVDGYCDRPLEPKRRNP